MSALQTDPLFSSATVVLRKRVLNAPGTVLVREGQRVEADTVIARREQPYALRVLDVAGGLGVPAAKAEACLLVRPGELVAAGGLVAEVKRWGLWRRQVMAPVAGRVQSARDGLVLLRVPQPGEELIARLPGVVHCVHDALGATLATPAARLRGMWGSEGHGIGPLTFVARGTPDWLLPEQIDPRQRGAILVAGRVGDPASIVRAAACLMRGLVVGSMPRRLARQCEQAGLPVLLTEGFGSEPMSEAVYAKLGRFRQRGAVLFGLDRECGEPPELVIPREQASEVALVPHRDVSVGAMVRVTAGPRRGAIGVVAAVPERPERTSLGDWVMGAYVQLGRGERVFVALPNIEVLLQPS